MVTFETKVYENDWQYLLKGDYLDQMILRCNYDFESKVLFINNVKNIDKVKFYADKKIASGILDAYYIVNDYAEETLQYFKIDKSSFRGGYYYSIAELVGIYLAKTKFLLHFSSDSYMQKSTSLWIQKALEIFDQRDDIIVANPTWNFAFNEAQAESFDELKDFFVGYGFSDQCYLIKTDVFKNSIYNEKHLESERYPNYGGELFEKRVDAYMRNHNVFRITSKDVTYIHKNYPKKFFKKILHQMNYSYFANQRLKRY